jgi:hypothetical protein
MKNSGVIFRQSLRDFPCSVELGRNIPEWRINRWGGAGLRFVPSDDEGFTLRGDKQRLLYKGQRRSHRFTILGDTAFEYDCILEREPESNVISFLLHGAENFDFFRQPDFLNEPILAVSYAVYKKNTLIGEGTGKLCHIHRPEIIEARGRRCWGDLAVVGNTLFITIPEKWLSEAKYPVIVDPTIGTTAVGSQQSASTGTTLNANLTYGTAVNKFIVSETVSGECTAYFYCLWKSGYPGNYMPVLFSDLNGMPNQRRSNNEGIISTLLPQRGDEEW